MMRPNYRDFKGSQFLIGAGEHLEHSAKGSEWKDHIYIKRINGTYYYPDSYEGGRHLPKGESAESSSKNKEDKTKNEKNKESKFSEYSKDDKDFDDKNFDEKNRLGDTDFFGFKRDDGTYVILEEDMKWELPEGAEITPDLIKRLEQFDQKVSQLRENGADRYTNKYWKNWAKEAIDGVESERESERPEEPKGLSESDIENLAKEVIKGNFGNGQQRKDLLGENYAQIQKRVNEILKGSTGRKKISSVKDSKKLADKVTETAKKIDKKITNSTKKRIIGGRR